MSVLSEVYAVPSRVLGVYRYILQARGKSESTEMLLRILAPDTLPRRGERAEGADEEASGREMIRETVNECVSMGLLVETGEELRLNPDLPDAARDPRTAEALLPVTLANLFFDRARATNHDFGNVLAWYLAQNAYEAPSNWPSFEAALKAQIGGDQLGIKNSNPYQMFEDWVYYLGFGWTHALKDKQYLTPDPTAHLKLRLGELFPGKPRTRHQFSEVIRRLSQLCPVFEGGYFRSEIDGLLSRQDSNHLSTVSSLAWLRLRDEEYIELSKDSDANVVILPDGDRTEAASHVTLLRAS